MGFGVRVGDLSQELKLSFLSGGESESKVGPGLGLGGLVVSRVGDRSQVSVWAVGAHSLSVTPSPPRPIQRQVSAFSIKWGRAPPIGQFWQERIRSTTRNSSDLESVSQSAEVLLRTVMSTLGVHLPVPFLAAGPVPDRELPGGTRPFRALLPAPHPARAPCTALLGSSLLKAGRINQISTVSQMLHFCTCCPETHWEKNVRTGLLDYGAI